MQIKQPKVLLLHELNPNYDETINKIYSAYKICTSNTNSFMNTLNETVDRETKIKTIRDGMASGHLSCVEHVQLTFILVDVSRSLTHQLVRHRIASSFSQSSQRYITNDNLEIVLPNSVLYKKEKIEDLINNIEHLYNEFIEDGIAAEDARCILPNCTCTNITVSMNIRQLLHVFNERTCKRAQLEIREIFTDLLKQVKNKYPVFFENAGPKCLEYGYCKEKKSCGLKPKLQLSK